MTPYRSPSDETVLRDRERLAAAQIDGRHTETTPEIRREPLEPKLKGSIGEESNHSNFSDQSSVIILSNLGNFGEFFARKFKKFRKFQHFLKYHRSSDKILSKSEQKQFFFERNEPGAEGAPRWMPFGRPARFNEKYSKIVYSSRK